MSVLFTQHKAAVTTATHWLEDVRQTVAKHSKELDWLLQPLLAFGWSRLLIFCVGIIGATFLETEPGHWVADPNSPFLSLWAKWDSQWYIQIAREGYWFQPLRQSNVAFFPLYPMLTRLAAPLFGNNLVLSGIILSNLAFLLGLIVLYRLAHLLLSEQTSLDESSLQAASRRTVFYTAFFPTAFFFSAVYTESLFLLLSVATAYFARQRHWFLAASQDYWPPAHEIWASSCGPWSCGSGCAVMVGTCMRSIAHLRGRIYGPASSVIGTRF